MNGLLPIGFAALAQSAAPVAFDIKRLTGFLRRHWRLVAGLAAASGAVAILALMIVTPRYTATATVLLEPRQSRVFGKDSIVPEAVVDASSVESQVSVVQSFNLLRNVAEREHLESDPEFSTSDASWTDAFPRWSGERRTAPVDARARLDDSVKRLRDNLDVQRVGRSNVLALSVSSAEPAKAARLANAVAATFVADQNEARYQGAKTASAWLTERLDALRDRLRGSEQALAAFRVAHGLDSASSEGRVTLSEQQLMELGGRLASARAELSEKQAKYEQARGVELSGAAIDAIPDVLRSSVVGKLREQQADLARKEADLAARYAPNYPAMANVRAERRDLDRSIRAEIDRTLANLKNDFDVARARETSLRASLMSVSEQAGLDGESGITLRDLVRTNEANKALYETFLAKAKTTQEQTALEERDARVISDATRPATASFPRAKLIVALAILLGATIGVGLAIALDLLRGGFETPWAVEQAVRVPVLASIPAVPAKRRLTKGRVMEPAEYLVHRPLSHYSEAIRALRVGVSLTERDDPHRVVLVTSSTPGEGKSTVATSLAFSAAASGQRVLLVDCDMRRPHLSRLFGLERAAGLADVLTGARPLAEVLSARGGLTLLPAGSKTQHPPDLLGSPRMAALLDVVRDQFDYVVVDAAPIEPVIDARVLANLVDKIVFVIRWRETAREIVLRNLDALQSDRKVVGVALNLVDEDKPSRYGSVAHGGAYGHGYYES